MAQHDFDILSADAATGLEMRIEINNALKALASNSLGASAPTVTYPGQLWYDSSTADTLKIRNKANTEWMTISDGVSLRINVPQADYALKASAADNVLVQDQGDTTKIVNEHTMRTFFGTADALFSVGPLTGPLVKPTFYYGCNTHSISGSVVTLSGLPYRVGWLAHGFASVNNGAIVPLFLQNYTNTEVFMQTQTFANLDTANEYKRIQIICFGIAGNELLSP